MIENIKNNFLRNKNIYYTCIFFIISISFYGFLSFHYHPLWWDEAVYIGMGKYLASVGHIGFWEFFRPPVLPIFYAFLFKLGLPMRILGKMLVVFSISGLIYLVYKIGEQIKKGTGILAGIFVVCTPVVLVFSRIALSDIVSSFLAVYSLYLFLNRKDFLAGILIGLTFLTRFPEGLILLSILLSLFYREYDKKDLYFKRVLYSGIKICVGFCILVLPYLLSNYFLYGDVLKPIKYANQIVLFYNYIYFKGFYFYIIELWHTAPFLFLFIFSIPCFCILFKKNVLKNNYLFSVFISAFIFCLYFFLQPHKELRYAIAFIPYIAILAGLGFVSIYEIFPNKNLFKIIFIIGIIFFCYKNMNHISYSEIDPYKDFYNFFENKSGVYLSTTPVPVALNNNILIPELFESYNAQSSLLKALDNKYSQIDGVILSTSDIFCSEKAIGGNCDKEIDEIYKKLRDNFKEVYSKKVGLYETSVFEKIK